MELYEHPLDAQSISPIRVTLTVMRATMATTSLSPAQSLVLLGVAIGRMEKKPATLTSIVAVTGVPHSTAHRAVADLVETGIVHSEKFGRKTFYTIEPSFFSTGTYERWFELVKSVL